MTESSAAAAVHAALASHGATVATAESVTGGRLAALLTEVPGASATYVGGVVAYATALKQTVLGVGADVLERHGAVSAECAEAMARGVRQLTGATYAVSTTGVAGPERQEGKPPGTVFVGLAAASGPRVLALGLDRAEPELDRAAVVAATCERALSALHAMIGKEEGATR